MEPLVSVITPIYNGENYIKSWTKCLISQTYKNLEICIINDGSSDNTHELIELAIPLLEKQGYKVKYIRKRNEGAAAAVNQAIKIIEGKYILLYDVDDLLMPDNIKAKVEFLIKHSDYGMVRNNGYYNKSNKLKCNANLFVRKRKEKSNEWIFEDILLGRTNNWSGTYMVDSEKLFGQLHEKEIYVSSYGQNMQIMLPVAFAYKTGFIDKPLMRYVDYGKSHSRSMDYERQYELLLGFESNRIEIIKTIDMDMHKRKEYIDQIREFYTHIKMDFARKTNNCKLLEEQYQLLCEQGWKRKSDVVILFLGKHRRINSIYQCSVNIIGILKAIFHHIEGVFRHD